MVAVILLVHASQAQYWIACESSVPASNPSEHLEPRQSERKHFGVAIDFGVVIYLQRHETCSPVCTENLKPDVMVMKPAQDGV